MNGSRFAVPARFRTLPATYENKPRHMQVILHDAEGDRIVECPYCHWKGSSSELKKGEPFELSNITEIFCPECEKYLGFIQHDEIQKSH